MIGYIISNMRVKYYITEKNWNNNGQDCIRDIVKKKTNIFAKILLMSIKFLYVMNSFF